MAVLALLSGGTLGVGACGSAKASAQSSVTMTVVHASYGPAVEAAFVPVTVKGHRYAFVVDSGAARTVFNADVADDLALPKAGAPVTAYSLGCPITTELRQVSDWSLGGHQLPPMQVGSQVASEGVAKAGGLRVAGLLGSDVLSSFGSVHLDFESETLVLGAVPPADDAAIPLSVLRKGHEVVPRASLTVGSSPPVSVTIDTGASKSYLAAPVASDLGVQPSGPSIRIGAVSCTVAAQRAPLVGAKLGPTPIALPQVLVGPSQIAVHEPDGGAGLIGEDLLGLRGSVWLDFVDQKLVLG